MKLILGMPSATSAACLPCLSSIVELQTACFERNIRFGRPAFGMAAQLNGMRDAITNNFYNETTADLLLMVDSDQSFEPEDFFNLLKPVETGLADVCAAAVGLKTFDPTRIRAATLLYQQDIMRAGVPGYNFQPTGGGFRLARQFYLYARVGMGVTLISRRAVELARRSATKFYESENPDGDPGPRVPMLFEDAAEDYSFCNKVTNAGGRVAVHVNSQVLHWSGVVSFQNNAPALLIEKGVKLEFPDSAASK
jgi:hypothetical protein